MESWEQNGTSSTHDPVLPSIPVNLIGVQSPTAYNPVHGPARDLAIEYSLSPARVTLVRTCPFPLSHSQALFGLGLASPLLDTVHIWFDALPLPLPSSPPCSLLTVLPPLTIL